MWVLKKVIDKNLPPRDIAREEKLIQVSDESELQCLVDEVIAQNPDAVRDYKGGKEKSIMFLVGQIMRTTKGKANPKVLREMFERSIRG